MTAAQSSSAARTAVRILGVLMALGGLVLAAGGVWLLSLGGSAYYLLAGAALVIAGVLIAMLRPAGAWLYGVVFVATVLWALWEVGLSGWALMPRLLAPGVALVLVAFALPVLTGGRRTWIAGPAMLAVFVVAALGGVALVSAQTQPKVADNAQALLTSGGVGAGPDALQTGADWPAYGGTYGARRYSPLRQINADNVGELKEIWRYRTGDMPSEEAKGKYSPETTPLKIGQNVYLCSAKNIMIALDAATGRERWRYDPKVSDDAIPYGATCRGVAYYTAPGIEAGKACANRVIEGTLDARLIAVDADTGAPCADFGAGGEVDLMEGIGDSVPGFYAVTGPPTIVRGVAVVGAQVLDGQKRDAPSGVVRGYDAVTGEMKWAWDLARPGQTGLPPAGQTYTRGTPNMWTIASGDEALGQVYLPMGNSAVDYYGADRRPESSVYSSSLVALDVTTGQPVWHFQTVHYDVWDYDLGSQGTLVDFPTAGGAVPALLLPSKQGDIYVIDRRNGRLLTPARERRAPSGGVEPKNLSPTQPYSTYHDLRADPLEERDMWGISPFDQLWCRIQYQGAVYKGLYTPPTFGKRWIQYPGYNGGSDWGGIAVDPRTGVIIANYNDVPNYNMLISREEAKKLGLAPIDSPNAKGGASGSAPQEGTPYAIKINAGWRVPLTGIPCKQPPLGGIRAIDLATGRTIWDRPLGQARRNGPFHIPSMLPLDIGTPNNGGAVVTAGGLVFIAAATDNLIRAIDERTGKTVWSEVLPAGGQATPITYQANGRQIVVIMAGGHHFMETPVGDYVVAYALPRS